MNTRATWVVSRNGRSLNLVLGGRMFATISRWSDSKTGVHAWWAVERHDGYPLGLSGHLASACRRAAAAANVDLAPPQDLLDEWGHEDAETGQPQDDTGPDRELRDDEPLRHPLHARCDCGHIWPVVYLPMPLIAAANAMRRATCPNCGNAENIKVASQEEAESA